MQVKLHIVTFANSALNLIDKRFEKLPLVPLAELHRATDVREQRNGNGQVRRKPQDLIGRFEQVTDKGWRSAETEFVIERQQYPELS